MHGELIRRDARSNARPGSRRAWPAVHDRDRIIFHEGPRRRNGVATDRTHMVDDEEIFAKVMV